MTNLSRRWFLRQLVRTGLVTWIGGEMLGACGQPETPPATRAPRPTLAEVGVTANATTAVKAREIALPAPRTQGTFSLEEALARRRSIRAYTGVLLSLEDIAQLFWATQGITRSWGGRTAPSAGASYPLEVYAATAEGVYHYLPAGHRAVVTTEEDIRMYLDVSAAFSFSWPDHSDFASADHHFGRPGPRVIVRAHRETIGTSVQDSNDVSLAALGHGPIPGQDVP